MDSMIFVLLSTIFSALRLPNDRVPKDETVALDSPRVRMEGGCAGGLNLFFMEVEDCFDVGAPSHGRHSV
jgi:hypothetical protein